MTVLYMGAAEAGDGLYKFVPSRGSRGQLFIAHWEPGGSLATQGRGIWVAVPRAALDEPATKLRELFGSVEYDRHFATQGPAHTEVVADGSVEIVFDHCVRLLRERGGDPHALAFAWRDYAARSSSSSASARSLKSTTDASLISS